jgi:malate permease and related proteins
MSQLIAAFTNNILPIVIAATVGFILGRKSLIQAGPLSWLVLYIFTPCLVFTMLTVSPLPWSEMLTMLAYSIALMIVVSALMGVFGWAMRWKRSIIAASILASLATNAGNYGIPLATFAFGAKAAPYATVFMVGNSLMTFTLGIVVTSWGSEKSKGSPWTAPFRYPFLYAFILAILFNALNLKLPLPIDRVVNLFSSATIPLMLLLLGLQLASVKWTRPDFALITTNVMRLIASPAVGFGLAALFSLRGVALQAGVMQAAMPTAVTATLLAVEFDLEPTFLTYTVAFSTLLSVVTLTPLIAWLS